MLFRSFYPRTIFILSTMSLILFSIIALINTILFRNEFVKLLATLEQPRIYRLFSELDNSFDAQSDPQNIKAKIDLMFFEFNAELFDKNGDWITGVYTELEDIILPQNSRKLLDKDKFAGFTKVYFNPNTSSPFYAVKIRLIFKDKPLLTRTFFYFLLSGIFVILVSTIVGWQLVSYLNKRLDRLKTGVSKVSQGEFDVHVEDKGTDEIAFLARSFNHMSQRIQKLVESLEESNAARQRLLAHASHEIKSPLTSIKGFIDIIEFMNVLSKDQQKTLLPAIKKDLNRVIKITNDMLQLTRIRDPKYKLEFKKINLPEFMQEEHSYFVHKAAFSQATAIYKSKIDQPYELETDPERLSQILDNLWNNALKYGDLSQPIQTVLFIENNSVNIKISNSLANQIEFPAERLFEPFYRGPVTADKASGSGLGLAIVRELTEKLDGKIETRLTENNIEITLLFRD